MPVTGTKTDDRKRFNDHVLNVLKTVTEYDTVLFNDRTRPLTVVRTGENLETGYIWAVLQGSNGGEYRLTHDNGAMLKRKTDETNEYGMAVYKKMPLETVEIVQTHQFRYGEVYEDVGRDLNTRHFDVVTECLTGTDTVYDIDTIHLRVDDEEIVEADKSGLFYRNAKKKVFNGDMELFVELGEQRTTKYRNNVMGEKCRIEYFDYSNVYMWFMEFNDGKRVPLEKLLFPDNEYPEYTRLDLDEC